MTYNVTPRKPLKSAQRLAFLLAHDSQCYWCIKPISDDLWDDEHVLARELGGSDDMDNRKPIHRLPCHKAKTALDRKLIAKSNRIRKKISGLDPITRKPKQPIRSRGFQQGSRPFASKPFNKERS